MTVFSGISLFYQNLLQLLLFVMLLAELYLLIEKISHRAPGQLCLVSSIMLTLNFLLLLFLERIQHAEIPVVLRVVLRGGDAVRGVHRGGDKRRAHGSMLFKSHGAHNPVQ